MPELPDLTVYLECIEAKAMGAPLEKLRLGNPFLLRTVQPRPDALAGRRLIGTCRIGKRLVLRFEGGVVAAIHLMILGRLHWKKPGAPLPKGSGLAAFDFPDGTLVLTESGSKRRASLHLFEDEAALAALDRGGLEVMTATPGDFAERLRSQNRTLKRAFTDPAILSAIGNAYSDEILHRARMSPFRQTKDLLDEEARKLFVATREVLDEWIVRLRAEAARKGGWPEKVTAFRPEMAVHGKFGEPCPVCGTKVQRIVHADNESNYCPRCQTGGRLLADRALSRLLHESWPKTVDDL
ncbi:MAG TPA: DNA-formamidopyrimidine glycosylase family protein [Nevskiaceae bacterium]|nr:DNA-formamidopyrimidine glycosylase family protein [Nevskiaceae bacterium]